MDFGALVPAAIGGARLVRTWPATCLVDGGGYCHGSYQLFRCENQLTEAYAAVIGSDWRWGRADHHARCCHTDAALVPADGDYGFCRCGAGAYLYAFGGPQGGISHSTAFFSLMPGGVIEMANIGGPHGADRTTIATLHAIGWRWLWVFALGLFLVFPQTGAAFAAALSLMALIIVLIVALLGGFVGRCKLPASWLLGALLAVAAPTASGSVEADTRAVNGGCTKLSWACPWSQI